MAVKEVLNERDKNEMRREAARIMAEMSRTGAIDAPKGQNLSTAKKQRPQTAKQNSKTLVKDKDGNIPWVPPMNSTFQSTKKDP